MDEPGHNGYASCTKRSEGVDVKWPELVGISDMAPLQLDFAREQNAPARDAFAAKCAENERVKTYVLLEFLDVELPGVRPAPWSYMNRSMLRGWMCHLFMLLVVETTCCQ